MAVVCAIMANNAIGHNFKYSRLFQFLFRLRLLMIRIAKRPSSMQFLISKTAAIWVKIGILDLIKAIGDGGLSGPNFSLLIC